MSSYRRVARYRIRNDGLSKEKRRRVGCEVLEHGFYAPMEKEHEHAHPAA
jgi:hypothetical protein